MGHTDLIINGKRVEWPSVTGLIGLLDKPFLARWRGKIGNDEADRISRTSAELGQTTHKLIEELLEDIGRECPATPAGELGRLWKAWYLDQDYSLVHKEQKVISKKKKFHGTLDAVLWDNIKQELVVVDWKITKNKDHFRYLQLAGYAIAYEEEYKTPVNSGLIVLINPLTKKISTDYVENLAPFKPLFLSLVKLYSFVKTGKIKGGRYDFSSRTKKAA